ncbi:hypothetical protein [Priestia megaterium]
MTKQLAINLLQNENVYLTKEGKQVLLGLIYNNGNQGKKDKEVELLNQGAS